MEYRNNNYHGKQNNQSRSSSMQQEVINLPTDYLSSGYFITDEGGNKALDDKLVLTFAKKIANDLVSGKTKIAKSQLRKYYDFVVDIHDKLIRNRITTGEAVSEIKRLSGFAVSAVQKNKAPKLCEMFINTNLNAIHSKDDVVAFKKHFEAITCFYPEIK